MATDMIILGPLTQCGCEGDHRPCLYGKYRDNDASVPCLYYRKLGDLHQCQHLEQIRKNRKKVEETCAGV